jgi:hypothetical protein
MFMQVETITPTQAEAYLTKNQNNRRVRQTAVDAYAADMKEGRWRLHHQGIAFSTTGRLLDGQHRLMAIVKAGIAVPMMVSWNVDESTFTVIDHGRKRDAGDALESFVGFGAPNYVSGVVRAALLRTREKNGHNTVTDDAIVDFYRANRELVDLMVESWGIKTPGGVTACAITCVLDKYGTADAVVKIGRRYRDRDFQGKDDPLNRLTSLMSSGRRYTSTERYRYALTAINAALAGRPLGQCKASLLDWKEGPSESRAGAAVAAALKGETSVFARAEPVTISINYSGIGAMDHAHAAE